ncbi:ABC transporter permease [Chryseolinea sp. T2]|uniref:ABC transporter permease n=1 Tax=Chryseolinea sp. T2 TaxID=3129255 RepID=UPI0030781DA5
MLSNYLTIAVRSLLKKKLYSFINIFGLALGVAICLVILRYVDFELSYDTHNEKANQIFRTNTANYRSGELRNKSILSGYAQGPAMLQEVPEIKSYIRTHPMYGGAVLTYQRPNGEPVAFSEDKIQWVDSTFFDVFTYKPIEGNLKNALQKPNSIVLTKKAAERYFQKGDDPLGKLIQISGGWHDGPYEVTAVIENAPENSHFVFDFILPIHNLLTSEQYKQDDGWGWNNFVTYVELHPNASRISAEGKLPALVDKYRGEHLAKSNSGVVITLQPVLDIHLTTGLEHESTPTISPYTIYFFVLIAVFILAIAWINYINLSTARAMERAREVGIKKAVGAMKSQLISQFVFESVLVNLIGVVVAVLIAIGLLPVLGQIVGKTLVFNFADVRFWTILMGLFLIGSLISGAYPAFLLSSFKTTEILKGKGEKVVKGFSMRKALVVFQFAASLILIAGTFAIYRQMIFMRNQDKGFSMERMLVINGPRVIERQNSRDRLISMKNELKKIPGVLAVATSAAIPGGGYNWGTGIRKDGTAAEANKSGSIVWVDPDFIKTYDMEMISGRVFNPEIKSDMESVIVNESAIETFGLGNTETALNERLILGGGDTVAIVGVLKNYNWSSLKQGHTPMLFKADTISARNYSILLKGGNISEMISQIETLYKEVFPGNPFDYYFLEDYFNNQYQADQQFAKIFGAFAILAIFIACMGLWGLASFTTSQKLREIGIRKVLGASAQSITTLLSWQFLKLVLISGIIALPLTYYGINSWLGNFANRIGMTWDLFVVPVVILALLALCTVSIQILRGAHINPARILRSE